MTELFKLALSNLKNSKRNSTVAIISVVLVCMLLFLTSMVFSIYRGTMIKSALEYGDFHAILVNAPSSNLELLNNNSQIKSIKVMEEITSYKIEGEYQDNYIFIRGIDFPFEEFLSVSEGRLPQNDKEIIVNKSAQNCGINISDNLNGFMVVGFYWNSNLDHYNSFNDIKMYAYTFKEVSKNYANASFIITLKSPINAYDKIELLAREINSESVFYQDALLRANGQYSSKTEQKSHNSFYIIFLLIISIFSGFVIYNAFCISLNERKKLLGILRSIGTSRKQLYILSMFEILIIAIISIPISLALCIGLSYIILIIINNLISGIVDTLVFSIHWPYIITSLLFIIITIIISASKPAIASSKVSPFNLIRNTKNKKIKKVKEDYPWIRKLFGEEGVIAYKNRKRNSQKFLGPIVTITLSLILFISVSAYINYLKLNVSKDIPSFPDFNIILDKSDTTNPKDIANYIKNMDYIDEYVEYKSRGTLLKVDNYLTSEAKDVIKANDSLGISIYALDDESFKKYQQNLGTDSEVIFYNFYKYYDQVDNKNYSISLLSPNTKKITLIKSWEDREETKLFYANNIFVTSNNYLKTFTTSGIVMSLTNYEKNYDILPITEGSEKYNNWIANRITVDLYSKKYNKLNEKLSKYIESQEEESVIFNPNIVYNQGYLLLYSLIFIGLFSVVGFIGLIAALNIFNTITANMNLRSREFSMLRSIGLSHKGLLKVVNLESLFLILTPLLNGLIISYIIVRILMKTSRIDKYPGKVYMPFPTTYVLFAVFALILLVLMAMLYNYNKLKKNNIIDAIRETDEVK